MKKRIDLPTLTFGILVLCLVIFFSFVKLRSGAGANEITSIGPGSVGAKDCGYCGWYSVCSNDPTRRCCTQWHNVSCDGGSTNSPPTISGTDTCGQNGLNGWCLNNAQLVLTTSDPQGYTVTISGDLNGASFTCGSSCTLDLPKGTGTANYTATADTSNLTAAGSTTWKYDPDPPTQTLVLNPASPDGANGWYISGGPAMYVNASDAISGVAYTTANGAVNTSPTFPLYVSPNGAVTITYTTVNNAGSSVTASQVVYMDRTPPELTLTINPAAPNGSNHWYTTPVTVNAAASDPESGIATLQYRMDGGAWQNAANATKGSVTVSSDGSHVVDFQATNEAGLTTTQSSQSFHIDQTKPVITLTPSGTSGSNGWYTSNVNVSIGVTDTDSGLQSSSYSVDGGAPVSNANGASVAFSDGQHTISVNATDNAGNQASSSISINVDTLPPTLTLSVSPIAPNGLNHWYTVPVAMSATAKDTGSGLASIQYLVDGNSWQTGSSVKVTSDGSHTVSFTATDKAGNSATASQTVSVDTTPPVITISSPNPNSVIFGTTNVTGQSTDETSGVADVQVSFDNGSTWTDAAPGWSYLFHSGALANGAFKLLARSTDNAGNTASPVGVSLILDNYPPIISVPASWDFSVSAALSVQPNVIPLKEVKILVNGDGQTQSLFDGLPAPMSINWNRIIGNIVAAPGDYPVRVKACDLYGVCTSTISTIIIQQYPVIQIPILPTAVPRQAPIQITYPIQKKVVSPPAVTKAIQPVMVAAPPPSPVANPNPTPMLLPWPVQVTGFITLMFTFLLLFDPRPAALWSLAKTIHPFIVVGKKPTT